MKTLKEEMSNINIEETNIRAFFRFQAKSNTNG
jgi:hypothetical protein